MRIAVLTSTEIRHRYCVNALRRSFGVVAVGYEETGYSAATVMARDLTERESRVVRMHFGERGRQEQRFFGDDAEFVASGHDCGVVRIAHGDLNSGGTLRVLVEADVETIVVFGTNLIKEPLLSRWPGRWINMHLGLSPYYRGTATNFYPLLNEEPEYVGATIHLLDSGIDSGPILRHARPDIVADDMPHTIGCKAIQAGIDALVGVLREVEGGIARPVPQWKVPHAKVYFRRDYHPRQVVALYRKWDDGLIAKYLGRVAGTRPLRLIAQGGEGNPGDRVGVLVC